MVHNSTHDRVCISFLVVLACSSLTHALTDSNITRGSFLADTYYDPYYAQMCVPNAKQVRWVFNNHMMHLNRCNIQGMKEERVPETQVFVSGAVIKGEKQVDALVDNFCKPRSEGGFRGMKFTEERVFIVGNMVSMQWVANAPFLAEPYRVVDAYATCGDKLLTILSDFDEKRMKFKHTN